MLKSAMTYFVLTLQSPVSPVVTLIYFISQEGLTLLKRPQPTDNEAEEWDLYVSEIHPWNYWNQAISTKPTDTNFNPGEKDGDLFSLFLAGQYETI